MMRGFFIVTGVAALSACLPLGQGDRLDPLPQELEIAAPPGTVVLRTGVDQRLVGDRLMDADEPELALRAYYRAAADNGLDADLLTAIGSATLALGRVGQAETLFRQAIDRDERHVPAWNNLGVTLMEQGEYGEARRTFETAYALDSGGSDSIRDNLRLAIARMEDAMYVDPNNTNGLGLIRRGGGVYDLRPLP